MREFCELFVGRDDAYGTYVISPSTIPNEKGKLEGEAHTTRGTPPYDKHLAGTMGIGIVPIRLDNTVMWFVIDVDQYQSPVLHQELLKKIEDNALPLVMTKSKSGGAHLWCFLTDPMQAKDAREVGFQYLKILGLPKTTEIFPKQIEVSETNVGNWINLPYFGNERVCVTKNGEVDLEQFIKLANASLASPADISHVYAEPEQMESVDNPTSDAPPCVDTFEANGVPEGGRDNTLFHVGAYLKRKYPDTWEDELANWNQAYCQPPMTYSELGRIISSAGNKDWGYSCDKQPMCGVCPGKKVCRQRKFGVKGLVTDDAMPFRVGGIRKINSEEPVFYMEIDGEEIRMSADDLLDYTRIKKLILKKKTYIVPNVKQQTWESYINEVLETAIIEEAPSIVGETGLILDLLRNYLDTFSQSEGTKQAAEGVPYLDGDYAHFRSLDFIEYLSRQVKGVRHQLIWSVLSSEAGAKEKEYGEPGDKYKLWVIPWKSKAREGSDAF